MRVIDFQDAHCKHCYRCVRSCQVKAIKIKNAQAQIMTDNCVLCGRCMEVCPQNAKTFNSDLDRVKSYLKNKIPTVVSIAPSYLGLMKYKTPGQVVDALLKLGFTQVRETAEGAAYVTNAYDRLLEEGSMKNIISTCCPSVNDLVEKYYPSLTPYMAPVVSPMIAHGMLIKELLGDQVKVVFLGPCIAKKEEAEGDDRTKGYVDAVINFFEVEQWMKEEGIEVCSCEDKPMFNPDPEVNRLYPVSGGVITSVLAKEGKDSYQKLFVDGMKNCQELFSCMERGEIDHCFLEVNMCEGGCVKGTAIDKMVEPSKFQAALTIRQQVGHMAPDYPDYIEGVDIAKQFYPRVNVDKMPTEAQIREILHSTGKYTKEQELNCGACGYLSCREKAIAVFQKKAEIGMCLPYAFEKAQSMANVVMEATPNMIFIVDNQLKIREFNKKAESVFGIGREDALEKYIFELMDDSDFVQILNDHRPITGKKVVFEDAGMTTLAIMVYIPDQDSVLSIYQDVTAAEERKLKHYNLKMETVEMAQNVIDKQMMVAQEIAGLLGETTAETKVILSKLRDSILFEEEM